MALYSVTAAKHATLSGTTYDAISISNGCTAVEVMNRSGSADMHFTVDGTVPAAGADNTYIVTAGQALVVPSPDANNDGICVVAVIGNGNVYSVTGVVL